MPAPVRDEFGARLNRDLGNVRYHAGEQAAASARSLDADAYTVGSHIVFGADRFQPATPRGRELIAHELVHVTQAASSPGIPSSLRLGAPGTPAEREADRLAPVLARPGKTATTPEVWSQPGTVQRRLVVDPDEVVAGVSGLIDPLTERIQPLITQLCPEGGFQVDRETGEVQGGAEVCGDDPAVPIAHPAGCECLCAVVNSPQTTTIRFGAGRSDTTPDTAHGHPRGVRGNRPGNPTVHFDPDFRGQYEIGGEWVDIPPLLPFAHELCGHARDMMEGVQMRPWRRLGNALPRHEERSVEVERAVADEQGLPRRGERVRSIPPI